MLTMCRIQRCEDLQFWAFICVRHRAFYTQCDCSDCRTGGIMAALFATHVPLSISHFCKCGFRGELCCGWNRPFFAQEKISG